MESWKIRRGPALSVVSVASSEKRQFTRITLLTRDHAHHENRMNCQGDDAMSIVCRPLTTTSTRHKDEGPNITDVIAIEITHFPHPCANNLTRDGKARLLAITPQLKIVPSAHKPTCRKFSRRTALLPDDHRPELTSFSNLKNHSLAHASNQLEQQHTICEDHWSFPNRTFIRTDSRKTEPLVSWWGY